MTPEERAVLDANEAFYAAFTARDAAAMEDLWTRRGPVACVHPGWAPIHERALIMRSWRAIFRGPKPPAVSVEAPRAAVLGDVAYVVCIERLTDDYGDEAGALVATNLFVREAGAWRIAHHQAGPLASDAEDDDEPSGPDGPDRTLN